MTIKNGKVVSENETHFNRSLFCIECFGPFRQASDGDWDFCMRERMRKDKQYEDRFRKITRGKLVVERAGQSLCHCPSCYQLVLDFRDRRRTSHWESMRDGLVNRLLRKETGLGNLEYDGECPFCGRMM